ncbi:type VII secretion-associated protein [Mycobacterium paragordonae]|uniref:type VII secretion-associated protein n=1 Tax=Mycobacterium paragordonae TaxID=1389713 RepID=UPI00106086BC|nr:type VII secretion-associated protein [Mycobacterium paragordonae]TDL00055.1 type VII secretion-associated protein [Mycobacterium paragordonae]
MRVHRAVIAAGPGRISRICCTTAETDGSFIAALDAVDDPVALVDERPVAVAALWCTVLRVLIDGHRGALVVCPTWWSTTRVELVTTAARTVAADEVVVCTRASVLPQQNSAVLVEIAERLVAISGSDVVAVPRRTDEQALVDEVAAVLEELTPRNLVIDVATAVPGAPRLARLIAEAVGSRHVITTVDDAALTRLAHVTASVPDGARVVSGGGRTLARLAVAGLTMTAAGLALPAVTAEQPRPAARVEPTTVLVEGQVALTIPAGWLTRRVITGPGSARVQVTSPSDPEAALHVTQTPTPGETLAGAADRLRRAIEAEPAGVFVDFNPAGAGAGRPAVTYREVRATHDVRWTVLLDGSLRISIGCQSRPAARDALRDACEQAVRTAHAVG